MLAPAAPAGLSGSGEWGLLQGIATEGSHLMELNNYNRTPGFQQGLEARRRVLGDD